MPHAPLLPGPGARACPRLALALTRLLVISAVHPLSFIGFARARVCCQAVEPIFPCSTSSSSFWWPSSIWCWTTLLYLVALAVDLVGPFRVKPASSATVTQLLAPRVLVNFLGRVY
jgi:hypothetical protein